MHRFRFESKHDTSVYQSHRGLRWLALGEATEAAYQVMARIVGCLGKLKVFHAGANLCKTDCSAEAYRVSYVTIMNTFSSSQIASGGQPHHIRVWTDLLRRVRSVAPTPKGAQGDSVMSSLSLDPSRRHRRSPKASRKQAICDRVSTALI